MPLVRLSTEHGARKLLERLVAANRCTIEQLDSPPPGHANPAIYRNLLRDPDTEPAVQPTSPRDFTPVTGPTPAEALALPLTLGQSSAPIDEEYGF